LKHVRFSHRYGPFAVASAIALAVAFAPGRSSVDAQVGGPPPPPVPNGTGNPALTTPAPQGSATSLPSNAPIPTSAPSGSASPAPSSTPAFGGRRRRRETPSSTPSPEPSGTPTSPAFATLDGTWEVQLQYIDHTDYSYLVVHQNGTGELSGEWRVSGKQYPFDGSYDGRLIRVLVKEPTGNLTWSGYVEGASDMVGTIDFGQGKADPTPFTAEHRAAPKNPFRKDEAPRKKGAFPSPSSSP